MRRWRRRPERCVEPEGAANHAWRRWARNLRRIGPGLITGASDDDPSGIGTYAQAGAAYGYSTLWTALFLLPIMIAIQGTCARIGLVTGQGLAGVLRRHYPPWLLYAAVLALCVANTINVGADLGAIAAGIGLLTGWPSRWLILPIAGSLVGLLILGSYRLIANVFKWLTLSLLAYVITPFLVSVDWWAVLRATLLPTFRLDRDFMMMMVAIWGTTITPYCFFWQADMVVEELHADGRRPDTEGPVVTCTDLQGAHLDTDIGMAYSNLVTFFIILTTGATLHVAGLTDIQTAQQAATALRPLAGDLAYWLFAAGLIGTGMLAIPVMAGSSAYALCATFDWPAGLNLAWREGAQFYLVMVVGIGIGVALDFLGVNPIKALVWAAVINGLTAPLLMVLILVIANSSRVMGEFRNGPWTNAVGWLGTVAMGLVAVLSLILI